MNSDCHVPCTPYEVPRSPYARLSSPLAAQFRVEVEGQNTEVSVPSVVGAGYPRHAQGLLKQSDED